MKFSGTRVFRLARSDFLGAASLEAVSSNRESGISESGIRDSLTVRLSLFNGASSVIRQLSDSSVFSGSSLCRSVLCGDWCFLKFNT